jgi:hypothetical protein
VRQYIRPGVDAGVWISSGRWGPKRVRVTQCWAVLRAEDVYTGLLRTASGRTQPGERGEVAWSPDGKREPVSVSWELQANAVWRFGRLFLRCPRCQRRATRVYVPTEHAFAACRRCWGLTYESRQERSYKPGRSRWGLILSPLAYALCRANDARQARAAAAAKRHAERREILRRRDRD